MIKVNSKLLAILAFAISLAGCSVIRPSGTEVTAPPDIRSILATLKMRYDLVDTMTTWVNCSIESHGKKEEIREYLYYEKPDKLRVDAMGPFNEPKVVALAAEKTLQIYFVAENELINGELSDEAIRDVFNIDLRVSDIRSAIFANPFLDANVDKLEVESYGDEYLIRRPSTRAGHREEITILARNTVVSKWRIMDAENKLIQEIAFSKYQEVGGIMRPLKATIRRPTDETYLSMESANPEINAELPETIFSLPTPEGAKVYQLSELRKANDPGSGANR